MKYKKRLVLLICLFINGSVLVSCENNTKKSQINKDNVNSNYTDEINDSDDNTKVVDIDTIKQYATSDTVDFEARSNELAEQYIKYSKMIKEYCNKNAIEIKYTQPIQDLISSIEAINDVDMLNLLNKISEVDTVHYFTERNGFNIDLQIFINETVSNSITFSNFSCKASEENIDENFEFENSQLDKYKKYLTNVDIDYTEINNYIENCFKNMYDDNTVFYNVIDDNRDEIIYIENNNLYYKLRYHSNY